MWSRDSGLGLEPSEPPKQSEFESDRCSTERSPHHLGDDLSDSVSPLTGAVEDVGAGDACAGARVGKRMDRG